MGVRFRKSVKICKGVRVNFSKSGASLSLGGRGYGATFGGRGTHVHAGIPGTGLSYTTKIGGTSHSRSKSSSRASSSRAAVQLPKQVGISMNDKGKVVLLDENGADTSTFSVGNSTISQSPKTLKKRKTWLWVLGWLFIFPIPLTILLIRKKNMNKIVKYAIILIVWLIYLAICSSSDSSTNTTESNNDTTRTSISQNSSEASENNNIKKLRFVNNRDVTVKVGDTETAGYLDVSVKSKKDFSPEDIIFISENPAVATISYTYDALTTCLYFEITGVGAGETQVYATSRDGMIVSDLIKVIVPQPILIESLELHTEKNEIVLGEKLVPSVSISPSNAEDRVLDWVSSDEAVATVDIDGTVIAVGDGSAIISATSRNGITSSFTVTVDGTKHLMNLRVTRSREDDVNIGDDWSFLNEVNGEYAYSSIGIGIGESLTLHTKITESDDDPDVGENTKWYTVTESDIANGFIVTMDVYVTENGGRNSGQSAHYIVTYTFSPIE